MEIAEEVEEVEVEPVWAEVTSEDGKVFYHNTVTNETTWTRPGSEVEEVLLTTYAQEDLDAWVREWSETGETTVPKSLKKACKQLKIKKNKLEEWLKLAAVSQKKRRSPRSVPPPSKLACPQGAFGAVRPWTWRACAPN